MVVMRFWACPIYTKIRGESSLETEKVNRQVTTPGVCHRIKKATTSKFITTCRKTDHLAKFPFSQIQLQHVQVCKSITF